MRILLINCPLPPLPGHTVRHLTVNTDISISLHKVLENNNIDLDTFHPDLFLQGELLGKRVFLQHLEDVPCPKLFWAVDSHLNMHWQRWYAQLFDGVLTPHPTLFSNLPAAWRVRNVFFCPFPGYEQPFKAHALRSTFGTFVGVVTKSRTQRARFTRFLEEHHAIHAVRMPFAEMMQHYSDTRVLPNEAICGEFNFRIMEGASCGCLVVTEDIGEALSIAFTPNTEVLTYRHAQELDEILTFMKDRPKLSEKIGYAAWQRVRKDYLPSHRWEQILRLARTLTAKKRSADECRRIERITTIQAARADSYPQEAIDVLAAKLAALPPHPDCTTMLLRLAVEKRSRTDVLAHLQRLFSQQSQALSFDSLICCIGAAFFIRDYALLQRCITLLKPRSTLPPNPSPFAMLLAVADLLCTQKRLWQPGFTIDIDHHCPETAMEFYLLAFQEAQTDAEKRLWYTKTAAFTDAIPYPDFALATKASASLYDQNNWRASFDYAKASLCAFRMKEGLEELALAKSLAYAQGEGLVFEQLLTEKALRLPSSVRI